MQPNASYDDREYSRILDRHEHVRWQLNRDLPWDGFRPERVTDLDRRIVYTAAVSEFTTLAASHNFLREFADDPDFSAWVSIWFYEETKHHYALRRWLALCGIPIPDDEVMPRARPYPVGTSHAGTCTMNIISELRAANWYADMAHTTSEPLLAAIMQNLAADEARHAVAFAAFGKRYVAREAAAGVRAVLAMAYFWLADPTQVKHPADYFYPDVAIDFRIDGISQAQSALARADAKIFGYLSEMTGLSLASARDLKRSLRALLPQREALEAPA
ncbi:hypothetical protein K2Z84_17695 [Candidatus Binatia bacterium]|jgi:hypothetical protein|nr:hypothetical protein [Candidatus Binatia bacterium]